MGNRQWAIGNGQSSKSALINLTYLYNCFACISLTKKKRLSFEDALIRGIRAFIS